MMAQIREYKPKDKEACLTAFKSNVPLFITKEETADCIRFLDSLQSSKIFHENSAIF
jgi:hypothetical protein